MTRIVLDGLPLAVQSAGVATYTRELAGRMAAGAPGSSFVLFQPAWPRGGEDLGQGKQGLPRRQGLQGRSGMQGLDNLTTLRSWRYPLVMGQPAPWVPGLLALESAVGAADLFHGTTYSLPARCRAAQVVTVHDLALLRYPELGNRGLRAMVARAASSFSRADRIIAVSRATRDDLVELCGIGRERIDIVYNGCGDDFAPVDREEARRQVDQHLGIASPYLLHVGTLEPRKNLATLIRAYAQVRLATQIPHRLVLAGGPGWEPLRLDHIATQAGVSEHVSFPGRLPQHQMRALYAGADLFVFPSLYEGFGLPVLEAMACGTPVVTSNRSALPEVAGDAALLVDPCSQSELATAIRRCLDDPDRLASMREAGIAQAKKFSWSAAARGTLESYGKALAREVR